MFNLMKATKFSKPEMLFSDFFCPADDLVDR